MTINVNIYHDDVERHISPHDTNRLICIIVLWQGLKKLTYNGIVRMSMICLAYNYFGLTLKVIGQKFGEIRGSAVNKGSESFSYSSFK